jgi:hypothetical protein
MIGFVAQKRFLRAIAFGARYVELRPSPGEFFTMRPTEFKRGSA